MIRTVGSILLAFLLASFLPFERGIGVRADYIISPTDPAVSLEGTGSQSNSWALYTHTLVDGTRCQSARRLNQGDSFRIAFNGSRIAIFGPETFRNSTRLILSIAIDSAPAFNSVTGVATNDCGFLHYRSNELSNGEHVAKVTFVGVEPVDSDWFFLFGRAEVVSAQGPTASGTTSGTISLTSSLTSSGTSSTVGGVTETPRSSSSAGLVPGSSSSSGPEPAQTSTTNGGISKGSVASLASGVAAVLSAIMLLH